MGDMRRLQSVLFDNCGSENLRIAPRHCLAQFGVEPVDHTLKLASSGFCTCTNSKEFWKRFIADVSDLALKLLSSLFDEGAHAALRPLIVGAISIG